MSFNLLGLPIFYEDFDPVLKTRFDFELDEVIKAHAIEKGIIKGVCNLSAVETEFTISSDNLRENVISNVSRSINRHRQIICALSMAIFGCPQASLAMIATLINERRLRVYSAEANSPLFHFLKQHINSELFVYSEYFGAEFRSGEMVDAILHEDLQQTSFEDESFDIILTSEVFEHIPDVKAAEKEVVRILKKGGIYCFTVPFLPESDHDLILAERDETGTQRYFAEPQYHGDPIRPDEGALVYRLFSFRDLKQRFEELGCDFKAYRFWSKSLGILDSNGWVQLVSKTERNRIGDAARRMNDNMPEAAQEQPAGQAQTDLYQAQLELRAFSQAEAQSQLADQRAVLSQLQLLLHDREQTLHQIQTSRRWRLTSSLTQLQHWRDQFRRADRKLRRKLHLPEQGVFHGAIDSPQNGERASGSLEVTGWVFSTAAPVTRVEAFLDNTFLGALSYGVERRDVVAVYPVRALAQCGYAERIALSGLIGGRRRLTVRVFDAQGHQQFYTRSILIEPSATQDTAEKFRQIEHALQEASKVRQERDELSQELDNSKQEQDELRRERDALKIELEGLNRFVPPGHFYSPIPSLDEVRQNEEKIFNHASRKIPAIDLNEIEQLRFFDVIKRYYDELPFGPEKTDHLRYHFENPHYSYSDAICLYSMIRHAQPKRIIEIGSGYSSCVTLDTNELFFDNAISCTFLEPYPELLLSLIKDTDKERIEIISQKLQDVDLDKFSSLSENDILFVDSTHVSKVNSDVNYIFFKVLPRLKSGVYIHFHDIFYPFEYPREWIYEGRSWNENYILHAFLQYNDSFQIVFFNTFMEQFYESRFDQEMPLCMKNRGGSIWLRKS